MKTGYSFGSLASFVETINNTTVKLTGDQTIAGIKTFSSNPISSAAQGTGGSYLTRKDYVDGALALKAPLESPALTGTPTAPTAAAGTNTTQIATTAFVTSANTAQLADVAPLMDGTAGIGASTKLARQDHRHPTDTSRAPLASPSFTGTVVCTDALNVGGTTTTNGLIVTNGTDFRAGLTVSGGNMNVAKGNVLCNNISSRSQQTFRQVYGDYGMFWHADDANHYLMVTNAKDQYGNYNDLRPFYVSNSTGLVTCGNGISTTSLGVSGGIGCGSLTVSGNATINGSVGAGDAITAPHLVSTAVDEGGLRFTGGSYGVMCYNGSDDNFYFLLTNMNDKWGGFNSLRPFTLNKRTGRVRHDHGLVVIGDIDTNVITTSDTISAGGNITSAGSVIAKSSHNNIPVGVTSYTRGGMSCGLGNSADAKPFMILMCPKYSGTALNKSGMSGRVTLSRGSTASGLVEKFVDFSMVSGYTTNLLEIYHQNAGAKIVTTTYNSVAYYALYFDAMSAVDVLFDGIRYDQDFVPILIQDASGYTTVTATVGELYAKTNSPAFTGSPTAPTQAAGTNNTTIATTAFVQNSVKSSMPVGSVIYSAASTAPAGFLVCNGSAVSRTTYASLFAAIGTTYGVGDGSTTFNLPDLRGEFIRGWDGGRGVDAGRGFGTWQPDAFQGHKHLPSSPVGYGGGWGDQNKNIGNGINETPGTVDGGYGTPRISTETRPRNIALLPCIKY